MRNKRQSAGHLQRPANKPWNRSSSLNPEQLGLVTEITRGAIYDALTRFERAVDISMLTEEQSAEAIQMISAGVTERMKEFTERLQLSTTQN